MMTARCTAAAGYINPQAFARLHRAGLRLPPLTADDQAGELRGSAADPTDARNTDNGVSAAAIPRSASAAARMIPR